MMREEINISQALQSDLYLKEKFPLIKTEIFLLNDGCVAIKPSFNPLETFDKFQDLYSHSIAQVTCYSKLIEFEPQQYIKKIMPVDDNNPYRQDLIYLTRSKFNNIILCRFPDIENLHITENSRPTHKYTLTCEVNNSINISILEKELRQFLNDFNWSSIEFDIVFINTNLSTDTGISQKNLEVLELQPYQVIKKHTNVDLRYLKEDDQYWFENVEKIYTGEIEKNQIYQRLGVDNKKTKVIIDCSVFNTIDLRYLLAFYDELYLAPPLYDDKFTDAFFSYNDTNAKDLLSLTDKGRIKFLIRQPETRLDSRLLLEAYDRNPKSIISKRAVNMIIASELVDLNKNYLFYQEYFQDTKAIKEIGKLYEAGHSPNQIDDKGYRLIRMLINQIGLPKKMLLSHVRTSHSASRIYTGIEDSIMDGLSFLGLDNDKVKKDAFVFEVSANSDTVQIASALGAFVAPRIFRNKDGKSEYNTSGIDRILSLHLSQLKQLHVKYCDFTDMDKSMNSVKQKHQQEALNLANIPLFCSINNSRGKPKLAEFDARLPSYTRKSLNELVLDLLQASDEQRGMIIKEYQSSMNGILEVDKEFNGIFFQSELSLLSILLHIPALKPLVNGLREIIKQYKIRVKSDAGHALAKVNHCIYLK